MDLYWEEAKRLARNAAAGAPGTGETP
jgi:hypothetical protein